MIVVARDIIGYDTISSSNDKSWGKLVEFASKHPDEQITFDFVYMDVKKPNGGENFNALIKNQNIKIALRTSKITVDYIKNMLSENGLNPDRVMNVIGNDPIDEHKDAEEPKKKLNKPTKSAAQIGESDKELKSIMNMANQLQSCFETTGKSPVLYVDRRFDQIGMPKTIRYIEEAVKMYSSNTGARTVIIDVGQISIKPDLIGLLAELPYIFAKLGIKSKVLSWDSSIRSQIDEYIRKKAEDVKPEKVENTKVEDNSTIKQGSIVENTKNTVVDKIKPEINNNVSEVTTVDTPAVEINNKVEQTTSDDNREVVSARGILQIDTISKGNDKPWERLLNFMEENPDKYYQFDFDGMEVYQPSGSNNFLKLLGNPRFGMTLHNNAIVARSIRMMCRLGQFDESRIKNIMSEVKKVETKEEIDTRKMASELMNYFETTGTRGTLYINRKFDQIGVPKTVGYVRAALIKYVQDTGIKDVVLYTGYMSIQPGVMEIVAKLTDDLKPYGATLTIISDNEEVKNKIGMYLGLADKDFPISKKVEIIKARLTKGRVGIMFKYKEGKARDEFGRQGKGAILSARVAIYKGISTDTEEPLAYFRCYSGKTFYTRDHWFNEYDRDILKDLEYEDIAVPIEQLGIYNDFIGSKYHFSTAVQYQKAGSIMMYYTTVTGDVKGKSMTIPERAKAVFDDFGVDYEEETLDEYIKETRKILGLDG